jgi:hypothetical protein
MAGLLIVLELVSPARAAIALTQEQRSEAHRSRRSGRRAVQLGKRKNELKASLSRRCLGARADACLGSIFGITLSIVGMWPAVTWAGGTCILHPAPFRLRSDTVRWSIKIASGGECIQGLRWSTIMIENISVTEPPKSGRLLVQGPSFRYFSNPDFRGIDFFKITISGTSLHMNGDSSIEVEVNSQ